jgi:glucose-1-phosphate cytidylyltransferase
MKVVILAGGLGSRLSEETVIKPKPMIDIGGKPIIWHIMKLYSHFGFNEFIICLGYKGYIIKEYFVNYFLHQTDVTLDLSANSTQFHSSKAEPWKITLLDTGADTLTGGRLKRVKGFVGDATFMMTYGDGLGDVDISRLLEGHALSKKLATVTAVQPSGRFGALNILDNDVTSFIEKPQGDGAWVNGGFFVLEPEVLNYIEGDHSMWEREPLEAIAKAGQLNAFKHTGFWKPMDTLRDKKDLEELWGSGKAPWRLWHV